MLTTVITHSTGDVFPAADWNTYLRDNLNFLFVAGGTLASAATVTPTNEFHQISGVTQIDNIATAGVQAGERRRLMFQAALTVRNNGGGTGNIRTLSGGDLGVIPNQIVEFVYDGSSWREVSKTPVSVMQIVNGSYATQASNATTTYADTGLTATITPKHTLSKILALVFQTGLGANTAADGTDVKLQRNVNGGAFTDLSTIDVGAAYVNQGGSGLATANVVGGTGTGYLDAPAAVTACIYKTQFRNSAQAGGTGTSYVQYGNCQSRIVLVEVLGA